MISLSGFSLIWFVQDLSATLPSCHWREYLHGQAAMLGGRILWLVLKDIDVDLSLGHQNFM